jgi:hypothetical protein
MHWLYTPANLGRMTEHRVRFPLAHMIHLIPKSRIEKACARYDAQKGPRS